MAAANMESITEMLKNLQQSGEKDILHTLYSDWNKVVGRDDININMDLRSKFDQWFLKCYKYCEEQGKLIQQDNLCMFKQQSDMLLCEDLKELLRKEIEGQTEFPVRLKLEHELAQLENTQAEEWIKRAYTCVKEEMKLMDSYNKIQAAALYISAKKPCEKEYEKVQGMKKALLEKLDRLDTMMQDYQHSKEQHEARQGVIENLNIVLQALPDSGFPMTVGNMNGLQNRNHQQEAEAQRLEAELSNKFQNFLATKQTVCQKFEELYQGLCDLTEALYTEVQHWQHQLKLAYVELQANVDLEVFAPWCAKTGQLIYGILYTDFPRFQHAIQSVAGSETAKCGIHHEFCEEQSKKFENLLNRFFQRTFVVTEQESWCVKKKDKTQIPKVTLRILGADNLDILGKATIKAYFVQEDNIDYEWLYDKDDRFQLNVRNIRGQRLKHDVERFVKMKKDQKYEGKFTNLQLTFDRGPRQKLVHEEKYRLIFHANVENNEFWTLSLPLVVTTGANQNCQCLASVMWQCYSTDVFAVPIETKTELPWSMVADMLNTKMKKLTTKRILTEDNLKHLKHRIPGTDQSSTDGEDEPMITLSQFCNDKLDKDSSSSGDDDKCLFSFWKWFLGIYNLIEKYLLKYWENGWIEGFISKADAEKKLKTSLHCRSAMYLLRFSDSHITDSQGLKSVFGLVMAAVLLVKKTKDNQKAKTVHHMDVAGHNKLKDKQLAYILLNTEDTTRIKFYQYLYPKLQKSETLFSEFKTSDPVVPGYTGVRDAFIVDLEQALQKLEITGKRQSSSSGSEDQDGYPDIKSPSLTGSKKIKRDSTETKSSCLQMANTPPAYGSSGNNTSSPLSQNTPVNKSDNFPLLKSMLTKAPAQQPVSEKQMPVSSCNSWHLIPAAESPQYANIPQTIASESIEAGKQTIHEENQNTFTPLGRYPATAQLQLESSTDGHFGGQSHQWSQERVTTDQTSSFMGLLQTGEMQTNTQSHFSTNPQTAGSMSQFAFEVSAVNSQPGSMYDLAGNQQVPLYTNIGMQPDGSEQLNPAFPQIPQDVDERTIVSLFIQHIIPKLSQEDKEKCLGILQDNASSQNEMPNLEQEPTSDDMVTSSSSGPIIHQSQLEAAMESDSGSVAQNISLFDALDDGVTSY